MRRLLLAVCVVAAPCVAGAQSIYKVQMPDGSILFTDAPPADAKIIEERSAKSLRPAATIPATPVRPATTTPPGRALPPPGQSPIDTASVAVSNAEREVTVAKRALELGREPLPGERLGLKGGGTRLSPEYDARIRGLEQAVTDAEARLKRALDAKNLVR